MPLHYYYLQIAMMPLNHILTNALVATNLQNHKKINHLMFIDDIKLFAKNEKELKTDTNDIAYTARI